MPWYGSWTTGSSMRRAATSCSKPIHRSRPQEPPVGHPQCNSAGRRLPQTHRQGSNSGTAVIDREATGHRAAAAGRESGRGRIPRRGLGRAKWAFVRSGAFNIERSALFSRFVPLAASVNASLRHFARSLTAAGWDAIVNSCRLYVVSTA